jgi:hypothetical protein
MKCPKCGYLGFEQVESCRNCGYEFSLSRGTPAPETELPLRLNTRPEESLDDLALSESQLDVDRLIGPPTSETAQPSAAHSDPDADAELPLFRSTAPDDEPLIKTPSSPRAPLAVRRVMPDAPRLPREHPRAQSLTFDSDEALEGWPVPSTLEHQAL